MTFFDRILPQYGSIISLGFLIVLLIVIYMTNLKYSYRTKLFITITYSVGLLILLELVNIGVETLPGVFHVTVFELSMNLLLLLSPLGASLFGSYVDYLVYQDRDRLKKKLYYMHPTIFTLILIIVNIFTPILYSYNHQTYIYERGPFYDLVVASVLLMDVVILALAYKRQKLTHQKVFSGSVFYLVFPLVGAVVQLYFLPNLFILYPASAIAVLYAYLTFESSNGSRDHLTKLVTRERATLHLEDLIASDHSFTVVMIDIDNFKKINDTHGHLQGDQALIKFSNALRELKGHNTIAARWGGDEFLLIMDTIIRLHVRELRTLLDDFLKSSKQDLFDPITFSMGCYIREEGDSLDINELLKASDLEMYKEKERNKNLKRRSDD